MGNSRRNKANLWTICALVFSLAQAQAKAAPWLVGRCELAADPLSLAGENERGMAGCLRGSLGIEATNYTDTREDGNWIPYGSAYAGLFAGPYVSLHGLTRWRDVHALNTSEVRSNAKFVDYAVVQFGNPSLNRYRITLGRMRIPFGLDLSLAPQSYQDRENRRFWRSPPLGAYVTFDDLRRIRLDLGLATEDPRLPQLDGEGRKSDKAISTRGALDVSALEGTRIIASAYAATRGERRYGLALSNQNRKGDQTSFEFVRRQMFASGQYMPFEQLLRVAYIGAWQKAGRWVIQFDDERFRFRRIVFNMDRPIFGHLVIKAAIGYMRLLDGNQESRLSFTGGVETSL